MTVIKCPRCQGNLILERDEYLPYIKDGFTCLQCDREFELIQVRREPTTKEQKIQREPRLTKFVRTNEEKEYNG